MRRAPKPARAGAARPLSLTRERHTSPFLLHSVAQRKSQDLLRRKEWVHRVSREEEGKSEILGWILKPTSLVFYDASILR